MVIVLMVIDYPLWFRLGLNVLKVLHWRMYSYNVGHIVNHIMNFKSGINENTGEAKAQYVQFKCLKLMYIWSSAAIIAASPRFHKLLYESTKHCIPNYDMSLHCGQVTPLGRSGGSYYFQNNTTEHIPYAQHFYNDFTNIFLLRLPDELRGSSSWQPLFNNKTTVGKQGARGRGYFIVLRCIEHITFSKRVIQYQWVSYLLIVLWYNMEHMSMILWKLKKKFYFCTWSSTRCICNKICWHKYTTTHIFIHVVIGNSKFCGRLYHHVGHFRADCRLVHSQRETLLQNNTVSHWLGANLKSALPLCSKPWNNSLHDVARLS